MDLDTKNIIYVDFNNKKFDLSEKTLKRFLKFIENRFSVETYYTNFKRTGLPHHSFKHTHKETLKKLLKKNNPLFLLDEICFPFHEKGEVIGCVRVLRINHLSSKKRSELVDFLGWLCEEHSNTSEKLKTLQSLERKFFTDHLDFSNEKTLFLKHRKNHKKDSYKEKIDFFKNKKEAIFNFSVLIQSHSSQEDIYKMALEIHYFSDRRSFCNIDQIFGKDRFIDQETLFCLGPMTLFIPEITDFPVASQKEIAHFLDKKAINHHSSGPEIIFGASYEFQDHWHILYPAMLKHLKIIQMTDDFQSYKTHGLFKFLSKVLDSAAN